MAAGAITIGLEKFMLTPDLEGSINHQPLSIFRDLYGVSMDDTDTLDLFKRVFASRLTKDARVERIAQLTSDQKERILVALNKRVRLFTRNLATLQNTTLENKRLALNTLINDITRKGATGPVTTPSGTAGVLNEIIETVPSPRNTPEVAQKKKAMRANILQRILMIAYYLANPSKLRALDQSMYDAMTILVKGLNGVKTPSQLTNILALVQAGAKAEDIRALDPLNYFQKISMPGFLESRDLVTGVSNEIITPLTNESLLSSYVMKLMGLMAIEGTVDEDRIKALKECLQGEGACIDKGRKEKGDELGGKLTTAIEPLYDTFRKIYDPLFSTISDAMGAERPSPFFPIMKMLKVFSHATLQKSILKTAPKSDVIEPGMYKYTGVPAELMQFIRKLNEQYGKLAKPLGELKLGQDIQYVYLPENLPIITSISQMRIPEARVSATPSTAPSIATLQSQLVAQEASAQSARKALETATKIVTIAMKAYRDAVTPEETKKAFRKADEAKNTESAATNEAEKADALVATTKAEIEKLEKTPDATATAPETSLTEEQKREILAATTSFFTKEPTTLYILSGGKANTVPFKLFTGSSEDISFNPVPVSTPNSIKISNVLPDIVNDTGSKPISMSAFMFAGFIAFKRGLSELTKEPDVSALEPVPVPVPAPSP
jgi:hypothetical protein